jgi:organic hydroperoxide reductase OsmC/OhrA
VQPFPHHYDVEAAATVGGDVMLAGRSLPPLASAAPAEFGGPGTRWSPETLLVAAVADCFVLTFRAMAITAKLPWTSLACDVVGTLDRVDHEIRFTDFHLRVRLQIPEGTNEGQAQRLVEKVERNCLVANSLKARVHLERTVEVARTAA